MTTLQAAFTLLIAGCVGAAFEDRRWYRWIRNRIRATKEGIEIEEAVTEE